MQCEYIKIDCISIYYIQLESETKETVPFTLASNTYLEINVMKNVQNL